MTSPLLVATGDRDPEYVQRLDWAARIARAASISLWEACNLVDIVVAFSASTDCGERYARQVEQAAGETGNWTQASIVARITAASCLAQSLQLPDMQQLQD